MRKLRKISTRYYFRRVMLWWLMSIMLFLVPAQVAMANTTPGNNAVPGPVNLESAVGASITDSAANWLEVTQTGQNAIMKWNNFDIGQDSAVQFIQPSATAAVLNRVNDATGTGIMGTLTANGRFLIINPAGIVFGSGATINVNQLIASSLNLTDPDFLNGLPYTFTGGATAGEVRNHATDITAERLYLIGKNVINKGTLVADEYVVMAAGETVTISENSPVVVEVSMPEQMPGSYDYYVDNSEGDVEGQGITDHVILAAGDIWSTAIEGVETLRAEAKGNLNFDGPINAYSDGSSDAVADVTVITGGDFTVSDPIMAGAYSDGGNASASVTIDAGGDVDIYNSVLASSYAENGSGDADVYITTPGEVTVDGLVLAQAVVQNQDGSEAGEIYSGNTYANVTIDNILGEGVTVGSEGQIAAVSTILNSGLQENTVYAGDAYAGIDIESCGDVIVDGLVGSVATVLGGYADFTNDEYSKETYADVKIKAFGDVVVNSEAGEALNGDGSNGRIVAVANFGEKNTADVTVLAVSDVIVNNGIGADGRAVESSLNSEETEIMAAANCGYINNAHIGIATRDGVDEGDVIVSGQIGSQAGSDNFESTNTSTVEICAARDVIVEGGYAEIGFPEGPVVLNSEEGGQIMARTPEFHLGILNTAIVDIFAGRDVIVHGAEIKYTEGPFNNFANGGNYYYDGGNYYYDGGQILALTYGSEVPKKDLNENTSSVGIYAQGDVTIHDATVTGEPPVTDNLETRFNGNGGNGDGQVLAGAHGEDSINDADIVICAKGDLTIDGEVIAEAGTTADFDNEHYADIVIAAGDKIAGTGWIYAEADPVAKVAEASIVLRTFDMGNILIGISEEHFGIMDHDNPEGDGLPDIEIVPVDCPECEFEWIDWTWCEDCEEAPFAPVAALWPLNIPRIEGCPELMLAVAMELRIAPETIQVAIGNALALNPSIQPCEACAALVDAVSILRDEDGSRMAAMVQAFNTLAPADVPFTPEMATSIAMAFEGAAEGTQYASVMEYIDAFVQYVAVLDTDLGAPVGDSVDFVMEKYGAGIMGNANDNIASFVATRLEGL